jgi:Tfp pilus assembly PilM family ATPase
VFNRLSPFRLGSSMGVLPTRRLLAVDAGTGSVKLLMLEEMFGRLQVLEQESVEGDGDEEALSDECRRQVQALIERNGDCAVALALPHYRALSQVLDLPSTTPEHVQSAIEEESLKLSGLGESQIVHDYSRLTPFGRYENPFWVTFCQEGEVQRQIRRCGLADLDLCEVTTTANALVAAFQSARSTGRPVALVDVGATGTLVTLLVAGQPVYSANYAIGGDVWAEALAGGGSAPLARAQQQLRQTGFQGAQPESLASALQRWHGELRRLLGEWLRDHPELRLGPDSFACVLAGGGAELPGLLEALQRLPGLRFEAWPATPDEEGVPARFGVARGAALHALGRTAHQASLLPDEVRVYWRRNHSVQVLCSLLLVLMVVLAVVLGISTWQKTGLLVEKRDLRERAESALTTARATTALMRQLEQGYEGIRPVLARQKETHDLLATLALLQQVRSNRSFWYVLFATRPDYFTAEPYPTTNEPAASEPLLDPAPGLGRGSLVVEFCVPESGEAARRTASQLVALLKESPLFRNVDSLPDERRRLLVDPTVVLPETHFALEIELQSNPFMGPGLPAARDSERGSVGRFTERLVREGGR